MNRLSRSTLQLVLVISCAHALVHVFELSLPAVEQLISAEFRVGRDTSGLLGTVWRIPFGATALLAGWLADRFGAVRMLVVYLLGCAVTAGLLVPLRSLPAVFALMFAMGCFAGIYHPAGLALISRATTPENRGAALGWHGIFGSLGIAGAPFLAGAVFLIGGISWRTYYALLAIPAAIVVVMLWRLAAAVRQRSSDKLREQIAATSGGAEQEAASTRDVIRADSHETGSTHSHDANPPAVGSGTPNNSEQLEDRFHRRDFFLLVTAGALSGFVYAAFMHFLPRYLDAAGLRPPSVDAAGFRNGLAAVVLVCGAFGQGFAGRWAKADRLPQQLVRVLLANVPFLLWMAFASGASRFVAACLLALVHFMNQPVYNSLIARLVPDRRRSTGYGFSNMICFGFGALGPTFAGFAGTDRAVYGGLAVVALVAAAVASRVSLPVAKTSSAT